MNIPTRIEIITVVNKDAQVVYQSVHVNSLAAAILEYNELQERNADLLKDGGTITKRTF